MLGFKKGAPKAPKVRKERKPITRDSVAEGLKAFGRNSLLVLTVAGILVLSFLAYGLFNRVGGGTVPQAGSLGGGLTLVGGFVTLWVGRKWGIIPF